MSAVTLETLRADFEAAVFRFAEFWSSNSFNPHKMKDPDYFLDAWGYLDDLDLEDCHWPENEIAAHREMDFSCRLFFIARDHGLNAAMMFKLSDGQIDPRGAA